jgi:hypothetical protein
MVGAQHAASVAGHQPLVAPVSAHMAESSACRHWALVHYRLSHFAVVQWVTYDSNSLLTALQAASKWQAPDGFDPLVRAQHTCRHGLSQATVACSKLQVVHTSVTTSYL